MCGTGGGGVVGMGGEAQREREWGGIHIHELLISLVQL